MVEVCRTNPKARSPFLHRPLKIVRNTNRGWVSDRAFAQSQNIRACLPTRPGQHWPRFTQPDLSPQGPSFAHVLSRSWRTEQTKLELLVMGCEARCGNILAVNDAWASGLGETTADNRYNSVAGPTVLPRMLRNRVSPALMVETGSICTRS